MTELPNTSKGLGGRTRDLVAILKLLPAGHRAIVVLALVGLVGLVLLLSSCASLERPESTTERLAYAEAQQTALADTVVQLYESGAIDTGTMESAREQLEQSAELLDAAWAAVEAGDSERAGNLAATALALIRATRQAVEGQDDG